MEPFTWHAVVFVGTRTSLARPGVVRRRRLSERLHTAVEAWRGKDARVRVEVVQTFAEQTPTRAGLVAALEAAGAAARASGGRVLLLGAGDVWTKAGVRLADGVVSGEALAGLLAERDLPVRAVLLVERGGAARSVGAEGVSWQAEVGFLTVDVEGVDWRREEALDLSTVVVPPGPQPQISPGEDDLWEDWEPTSGGPIPSVLFPMVSNGEVIGLLRVEKGGREEWRARKALPSSWTLVPLAAVAEDSLPTDVLSASSWQDGEWGNLEVQEPFAWEGFSDESVNVRAGTEWFELAFGTLQNRDIKAYLRVWRDAQDNIVPSFGPGKWFAPVANAPPIVLTGSARLGVRLVTFPAPRTLYPAR